MFDEVLALSPNVPKPPPSSWNSMMSFLT